jgi:hypothetical protein
MPRKSAPGREGMMTILAVTIKDSILKWTQDHSGYEIRHYLGMSHISECPRVLYYSVVDGSAQPTLKTHLFCYAGYLHEQDMIGRLISAGLPVQRDAREIVAHYDSRVRGHIDGMIDGELLEIKSVLQDKLARIRDEQRIVRKHYDQVQMYLRHGGFQSAVVVYVARDTGEIEVLRVTQNQGVADHLDSKAKNVLRCVDEKLIPACECRRCER